MKTFEHLQEMVIRCEDESEDGPGHPAFIRTGMEGGRPSLTWLDPKGHERATVAFDWFDGRMRVLVYDAARFSNTPLVLYLDPSGAILPEQDDGQ